VVISYTKEGILFYRTSIGGSTSGMPWDVKAGAANALASSVAPPLPPEACCEVGALGVLLFGANPFVVAPKGCEVAPPPKAEDGWEGVLPKADADDEGVAAVDVAAEGWPKAPPPLRDDVWPNAVLPNADDVPPKLEV
jgi:hypothetical protein